MALTDPQKAKVRLYLGYAGRFYQVNTQLESAMDAISPEMQTEVVTLLASLADVDAKLLDSHSRLKALKADEVELPGANEITMLRDEGKRFVGRLAAILGVPVMHNAFSTSSGSAASGGNYVGGMC